MQRVRVEPCRNLVHGLAPAPKAVVAAATPFSHAGHGALKGVRMQVGYTGAEPSRLRRASALRRTDVQIAVRIGEQTARPRPGLADRKSTRLNSSQQCASRMPYSA